MNRVDDWVKATQAHEGYFAPGENSKYPNGTPAWSNNNPGNIRPTDYSRSLGEHYTTGARGNFVYYKTYDIGLKALKQFLFDAATDVLKPYRDQAKKFGLKSARELTLQQFYGAYAPQGDGNNPNAYGADIAKRLGVSLETKVGSLIEEKPPVPVPSPVTSSKGAVISRKQGDIRWATKPMGQSSATLGRKGCLVTDVSDILHWLGIDQTPDILARVLDFTPSGDLYWASLKKVGIELVFRYREFEKNAVANALKHPTQCVILEFRYAGARHWCWATSKDWLGRYKIADPLIGDFGVHTRYGAPVGLAVVDKM